MSTKIVRYTNTNVLVPVKESFTNLAEQVNLDLGFVITIDESYKYEWEIVDELRNRIKDPNLKKYNESGSFSVNYAKNQTKMLDIATQESQSVFNDIKSFINTLPANEFEPPIGPNPPSIRDNSGLELVYSIPNYTYLDPRRTGRIVRIGPRTLINPTLLKYLVDNAGKYGFIHYGPLDPAVWYWRGDKLPILDPTSGESRYYYTKEEVVNSFTGELSYLL